MPKKPNHTKSRKITFAAINRKRRMAIELKSGTMKRNKFMTLMRMPLKRWLKLKKQV